MRKFDFICLFIIFICAVSFINKANAEEVKEANLGWSEDVNVFQDNKRDVTCWVFKGLNRGGISCIPNDQINKEKKERLKGVNEDIPIIK